MDMPVVVYWLDEWKGPKVLDWLVAGNEVNRSVQLRTECLEMLPHCWMKNQQRRIYDGCCFLFGKCMTRLFD